MKAGWLVLLAGLSVACGARQVSPAVGRDFPEPVLTLTDGGALRLADRRGEVTVIALFTTWCPASHDTIATVASLRKLDDAGGVDVVAVDVGDTEADVVRFAARFETPLRIARDPAGRLAKQLGLETIPAVVLVDRRGVVRNVHSGYHGTEDLSTLAHELADLVAEPAPEQDVDGVLSTVNELPR
jgi:peroxiredoxin